jgi:hypothetical protein
MALAFGSTQGKAISNKVDSYTMVDGDNKVRIFGGILPRYVYWLKGTNDKPIPVECLSFNRAKEKFDNLEVDHVRTFYPEVDSKGKHLVNCQWSYSVNCIDPKDGKAKVLNLKKKLFEQILSLAEDLGDPTNPETGWDICFKRAKTGALAFNVEYTLQQIKCSASKRPLTDEEKEEVAKAKDIDSLYPRPAADEILALLIRIKNGGSDDDEEAASASEKEAVADLT